MKLNYKKSIIKFTFIYLAIFIPLMFFRFPDIRNEIKYLAITRESLNNNLFILNYLNNLYPDKPPFYFWILKTIDVYFPKYFFQLGILIGSIIPSYIISILSYNFILNFKKTYKFIEPLSFTITLALIASPLFIGGTSVLRMDMLMYLFIFSSIYLFFNMYYGFKIINYKNLIFMYAFIFLGLFTKGIVGFIDPIIIILSFLLLNRDLKFLKKIHFTKGVIFIFISIALWFFKVYTSHNGINYLNLLLGEETLGRIVKSKAHVRGIAYYLKHLPLVLIPYGIGVFFSIHHYIKNIRNFKNWKELEKIFFSMSLPLFILLSLASGKLLIYLLPVLYGFIGLTILYLIEFKDRHLNKILINIALLNLIIPFIINKKLNRDNSVHKTLNIISSTMLSLIFLVSINGNFYSKRYTLKPIIKKIEDIPEENIYAYRFEDFQNAKYIINKNIIPINNGTTLILPKESFIITKSNRKEDISKDFKNAKIILKNKNYYLYKI